LDWFKVNALVPMEFQGGHSGTAIHLSGEPKRVVFRSPRAVMGDICRYLGADIASMRLKFAELGFTLEFLPLPIHPDLTFVPLPFSHHSRLPRANGYVSLTKAAAFKRCDSRSTTIWFSDGSSIKCGLDPGSLGLVFQTAQKAYRMAFPVDGSEPLFVRESGPVWLLGRVG